MTDEATNFLRGYLTGVVTTTYDSKLNLDKRLQIIELANKLPVYFLNQAGKDCNEFIEENAELLKDAGSDIQNGYSFWLSRNKIKNEFGVNLGELGETLRIAAEKSGEVCLVQL